MDHKQQPTDVNISSDQTSYTTINYKESFVTRILRDRRNRRQLRRNTNNMHSLYRIRRLRPQNVNNNPFVNQLFNGSPF